MNKMVQRQHHITATSNINVVNAFGLEEWFNKTHYGFWMNLTKNRAHGSRETLATASEIVGWVLFFEI